MDDVDLSNDPSKEILETSSIDQDKELLTYEGVLAEQSDKAIKYHSITLKLELVSKIFDFAILGLLVWFKVPNYFRDISPFGSSYSFLTIGFVSILFLLVIFIIGLPIAYYSEQIERRFEFATRTTKGWMIDKLKELALILVIFTLLIEALYSALYLQPDIWWFYGFLGYFIFAAILSSLSPLLISIFTKIEPLQDGEVRTKVEDIAEQMDLQYEEIYLWKMSQQTTKANAAVVGFGKTIRIMLGDTLTKNFRPDEIQVVMAHEISHQKSKDIYRGILFSGFISLIAFYFIDIGFDKAMTQFSFTGKSDPASIGYLIFALTLIMEILSKATLFYTRRREKAADLVAIAQIRDMRLFESAFARLSKQNLSFPNPSKLEVWLRYSHPPIKDRISYAQQYFDNLPPASD